MRRKGNPSVLLVGMQTGATTVEFLKSLKIELPSDPVIPLLGLYPKNPETPIQKSLCTPMFRAAQFIITKWWKKLWFIYTMEYYAAERKKELLPFLKAWVNLESIMLSEISQAVKEKYHMISPIRTCFF